MLVKRKEKNRITIILLVAFSIVTALGSFNPFAAHNGIDHADYGVSSPVSLFVQGLFICWILKENVDDFKYKRFCMPLLCFFGLLVISSFINMPYGDFENTAIYLIKIFLCIALYASLPIVLCRNENAITITMLFYALTMALISILFLVGALDSLSYWSKGRAYILNENPNTTSSRLSLAFLFIIYLATWNYAKWGKWCWLLLSLDLPIMITIMATGSRGSFIITIISLVIYMFCFPSKNIIKKYTIIIASAISVSIAIIIIVQDHTDFSLFERLSDSIQSGGNRERELLIDETKSIISDYPIFGSGCSGYKHEMVMRFGEPRIVHNIFWHVFAITGAIGLSFFIWFFISLFLKSFKIRHRNPMAFTLICFTLLLGYKTGGALSYIVIWYAMALTITLCYCQNHKYAHNHNIKPQSESGGRSQLECSGSRCSS